MRAETAVLSPRVDFSLLFPVSRGMALNLSPKAVDPFGRVQLVPGLNNDLLMHDSRLTPVFPLLQSSRFANANDYAPLVMISFAEIQVRLRLQTPELFTFITWK